MCKNMWDAALSRKGGATPSLRELWERREEFISENCCKGEPLPKFPCREKGVVTNRGGPSLRKL